MSQFVFCLGTGTVDPESPKYDSFNFGTLITGNYKKGRKNFFERKKTISDNLEL